MGMPQWVQWALIGGCVLSWSIGCSVSPQEASRQSAPGPAAASAVACPMGIADVEARHVVMILWDRSEGGVQVDIEQMVQQLKPATHLYGQDMTHRPSHGSAMFLQVGLPDVPGAFACVVKNPFDLEQKRRCQEKRRAYDAQHACLAEVRQRIVTQVQALTPTPTTHIDISGAVAMAAATFAVYPPSTQRWLVVYASFGDTLVSPGPQNRVQQAMPDLQGATVIVRTLPTATPAATAQGTVTLTSWLTACGGQVRTVPLAAPWSVVWHQEVHPNPVRAADSGRHPFVPPPASELAAFMVTLTPGAYSVIVASHMTEQAAQAEMRQIQAQYPALRPWSQRLVGKKTVWAVHIGDVYSYDSAIALKNKAIGLGLRSDTFVWDSHGEVPVPAGLSALR